MTEPKTFVLKRDGRDYGTRVPPGVQHTWVILPEEFTCAELEVTVSPQKSVRERRAEVLALYGIDVDAIENSERARAAKILDALEAIDRGER